MFKEECINLAVFDTDILHIQAIRKTVDSTVRLHHIDGSTLENIRLYAAQSWDLILFSLDNDSYCSRLALSRILECSGEIPVLCYAAFQSSLVKLGEKLRTQVSFLSFKELVVEIEEFGNLLNQGDSAHRIGEKLDLPETDLLHRVSNLSPRELDIFSLFGKGHGASEVAALFNCSVSTVESHIRNVRSKLRAGNAIELRQLAFRLISVGHCRALLHEGGHICPEIDASIGSCPHVRCA
jgi:DNA-binding CsgD family transcriptional regulator